MTNGFKLNERGKRWIHGIKSGVLGRAMPTAEAGPALADPAFKIM